MKIIGEYRIVIVKLLATIKNFVGDYKKNYKSVKKSAAEASLLPPPGECDIKYKKYYRF